MQTSATSAHTSYKDPYVGKSKVSVKKSPQERPLYEENIYIYIGRLDFGINNWKPKEFGTLVSRYKAGSSSSERRSGGRLRCIASGSTLLFLKARV